jgi:hypothetical protein
MADVQTSEVDENLHQSVWVDILKTGTSSKDEQLVMRPLFVKNQI